MATTAEIITQLYVGYYDRAPDPEGLNYWVGRLSAGMTVAQIAQSFAVQTESTAKYPYLANPNIASSTTFITTIYQNLFGRAPDPEGLAYWQAQLTSGGVARVGTMIIDIISGAQGDDKTVVANKVAVGLDWSTSVVEIPGFEYNNTASTSANSVLDAVTKDPASVDAAKAATDAFVAGGGGGGSQAHTLSVNQESLNGTIFDAPIFTSTLTGNQIQTLTSVDKLTGTGTADAVNAVLNGTEVATKATLTNVENVNLTAIAASVFDAGNSTGITNIASVDSSANLTVRNLAAGAAVGVKSSAAGVHTQVQFANAATAGTTDAVTVKLDSVGRGATAGNAQILNVRGETTGAFETLNIQTSGGASRLANIGSDSTVGVGVAPTAAGSGLKAVNVTGAANLRIDGALLNVTTVDANAFEGNLRVLLDATKNVTVTGGKGADYLDFAGGLSNSDTVNGGDGRDTIAVTSNSGLGDGTKVTAVEILRNDGAANATIFDLSKVASFDAVVHNTANTATYNNLTKAGAADATMGITQLSTGAVTVSVKDANALGSNSDSLNVTVGSTTQAATFAAGAITTSAIEKITVDVKDAGGNTATAGGAFIVGGAALGTVEFKGGSLGVAFNAGAPGGSGVALTKIDGSAFVGDLTVSGNASSQVILGGSGNDTISTGGRAAFALGTVADTLTGGSGGDVFDFVAATDAALTVANITAVDAPAAVTATNRAEIATITDLNLGGANAGTLVDTINFTGAAGTLGAVAAGGFAVVNGGSPSALTGTNLGAALNALVQTGVLGLAGAGNGAAGLFTWAGDTYLVATTNTAVNDNFGATGGEDIVIKVTGVTGTLDVTDFV